MRKLRGCMLMSCIAVVAMSLSAQADSVTYDFNTAGDLDANFSRVLQEEGRIIYGESASGGISDTRCVQVNQESRREARHEKTILQASSATSWKQSVYFKMGARSYYGTGYNPILALGTASGDTSYARYFASSSGDNHLSVGITPRSDGYRLTTFSFIPGSVYEYKYTGTFSLTEGSWYYFEAEYVAQENGTYSIGAIVSEASSDGTVGSALASKSYTFASSSWLASEDTAHTFFHSDPSANIAGLAKLDNYSVESVPEPATMTLLAMGAIGILCRKRR